MQNTNLDISLVPNTSASEDVACWAHINQGLESQEGDPFANFYDIYRMFLNSQSGLTAHMYGSENCNIKITDEQIEIPMQVNVWPCSMDLNYNLTWPENSIPGKKKRIEIETENSIVVKLAKEFVFDHIVEIDSFKWEKPCYDKNGEEIEKPDYEVVANKLIFDTEVEFFASIRVNYRAIGYLHPITIVMKNTSADIDAIKDPDVKSYSSKMTVFLHYNDGLENGGVVTKELELVLTDSMLNCMAQCPDGSLIGGIRSLSNPPSPDPAEPTYWTDVYYNACNGAILDTNKREIR